MDNNKKKTAAMAAVMYYLKTEEEAAMQGYMQPLPAVETPPPVPLKLWAISGRQTQMQMRNLMQMRALR